MTNAEYVRDKPATYFAPAGRDAEPELRRREFLVQSASMLQQVIDAVGDAVLILNGNRQVIGVNRALLGMLDCRPDQLVGHRLGEIVGCRNVSAGPDGCGTSPNCLTCGAIHAILESQRGDDQVTRECRISLLEPIAGALDLSVSAMAVRVEGERFSICTLRDISDQKRLAVLARLFFHDVINTAGGIQGYAELLRERVPKDSPEDEELARLAELADQLVEEIRAQRDLTYAESGEFALELDSCGTRDLLERLQALYAGHPAARGRELAIGPVWDGELVTDRRLLSRVIGNMLKNALEAVPPGATVTLSCREDGGRIVFLVHNPGVMPHDVQGQIFQRSFSTKAANGRGIGTHSMKLFGERYLGGQVTFTSTVEAGTTFRVAVPRSGPGAAE